MEVLRDGQVLSLSYTLEQPLLVIPPKPKQLSYLIVAGLVFLPLSMELLNQRFLIKSIGDYGVPAPIKTLDLFCKVRGTHSSTSTAACNYTNALPQHSLPPLPSPTSFSTATSSALSSTTS